MFFLFFLSLCILEFLALYSSISCLLKTAVTDNRKLVVVLNFSFVWIFWLPLRCSHGSLKWKWKEWCFRNHRDGRAETVNVICVEIRCPDMTKLFIISFLVFFFMIKRDENCLEWYEVVRSSISNYQWTTDLEWSFEFSRKYNSLFKCKLLLATSNITNIS